MGPKPWARKGALVLASPGPHLVLEAPTCEGSEGAPAGRRQGGSNGQRSAGLTHDLPSPLMFTQDVRPPGVPAVAPGACLVLVPLSPWSGWPRPPARPSTSGASPWLGASTGPLLQGWALAHEQTQMGRDWILQAARPGQDRMLVVWLVGLEAPGEVRPKLHGLYCARPYPIQPWEGSPLHQLGGEGPSP